MTHQRTRWIQNGNAQVALGAELDQILVGGKEPLDVAVIVGDLAVEDPEAGRSRDVVLEVLPEAPTVPERARADPGLGPVDALRDERVADAQRRGEVLDQRIEEVAPGHRGGALDDRAKRLLDLAPPRGFVTNFAVQGRDRLVGLHVLDGQDDLVGGLLEEGGVGLGILVRRRAGDREDADAPALGDQRHEHVRAHAVLEGALLHPVPALMAQIPAEPVLLVLERPADVAFARGHFHADGEVRCRQGRLQDEEAEHVLVAIRKEDRRAIEGHGAPERAGDRVEEILARQVRDDRVVDLEQRAVARRLRRVRRASA